MSLSIKQNNTFLCDLGECPIWHNTRESWLWLDINNSTVYELPHASFSASPKVIKLDIKTSFMAVLSNEDLILIATEGAFTLNLETAAITKLCPFKFPENMRTNDGGIDPLGSIWFGTMGQPPSLTRGDIYKLKPNLELTKVHMGINIPNTFCWDASKEALLFADSYEQILYRVSGNGQDNVVTPLIDLSSSKGTPDGGAMDTDNNLWIAIWGAGEIRKYNMDGEVIDSRMLPVPQPSSCCFGGPDYKHLFITSAREGLSHELLEKNPLSGAVFCIELSSNGRKINNLNWNFN